MNHVILKTDTENIHLAPAHSDLLEATLESYRSKDDSRILKNALEPVLGWYDYILIDTPTSYGHFIVNGAVAADSVLLCLDPGIFALEGIDTFNTVLKDYCESMGVDLNIAMALLTKYQTTFPFMKNPSKEIKQSAEEILVKKTL